jgi:shikimate kinase
MATDTPAKEQIARVLEHLGDRSIVLVGMPGSGKSSVGRRLATLTGLDFVDADAEIEAAAGMTIPEIFAKHGEPAFRTGEARVIARLLERTRQVLSTGGGAFNNPQTRERVAERGISVWLQADISVLLRRVKRKNDRPLLQNVDPEAALQRLLREREPFYAEADIVVSTHDGPHHHVVNAVVEALDQFLMSESQPAAPAEARP